MMRFLSFSLSSWLNKRNNQNNNKNRSNYVVKYYHRKPAAASTDVINNKTNDEDFCLIMDTNCKYMVVYHRDHQHQDGINANGDHCAIIDRFYNQIDNRIYANDYLLNSISGSGGKNFVEEKKKENPDDRDDDVDDDPNDDDYDDYVDDDSFTLVSEGSDYTSSTCITLNGIYDADDEQEDGDADYFPNFDHHDDDNATVASDGGHGDIEPIPSAPSPSPEPLPVLSMVMPKPMSHRALYDIENIDKDDAIYLMEYALDYTNVRFLGAGFFASVYEVNRLAPSSSTLLPSSSSQSITTVRNACKVYTLGKNQSPSDCYRWDNFIEECTLYKQLARVSHENIVKFMGNFAIYCEKENTNEQYSLSVVRDFCTEPQFHQKKEDPFVPLLGGIHLEQMSFSVQQWMMQHKLTRLNGEMLCKVFFQIGDALSYLHSNFNFCHNDLKSDNIAVCYDGNDDGSDADGGIRLGTIKLIDFGNAKQNTAREYADAVQRASRHRLVDTASSRRRFHDDPLLMHLLDPTQSVNWMALQVMPDAWNAFLMEAGNFGAMMITLAVDFAATYERPSMTRLKHRFLLESTIERMMMPISACSESVFESSNDFLPITDDGDGNDDAGNGDSDAGGQEYKTRCWALKEVITAATITRGTSQNVTVEWMLQQFVELCTIGSSPSSESTSSSSSSSSSATTNTTTTDTTLATPSTYL